MEVNQEKPAWLDESHPNFLRWEIARKLSIERGKFVNLIVNHKIQTKRLTILDLGSGEGGTAKVFAENNFVVSFDLSLIRLQRQRESFIPGEPSNEKSVQIYTKDSSGDKATIGMRAIKLVNGTALQLPFSDQVFDLIIIQDVIEHLTEVNDFYSEVKRVLKINGSIYLSTPNKLSFFNIISDPHFGLPIISLLKRESIKKYFLKYFRKDDYNRKDIAQLLSLNDLQYLFRNEFEIKINTKFTVEELFNGNKGIVWSDFHLSLIKFCKFIKLDNLILKLVNDKVGVINKYFTPTFYLMLQRKQISNNLN